MQISSKYLLFKCKYKILYQWTFCTGKLNILKFCTCLLIGNQNPEKTHKIHFLKPGRGQAPPLWTPLGVLFRDKKIRKLCPRDVETIKGNNSKIWNSTLKATATILPVYAS